jgi:isopenicillin-N N-acyltransferase-like protein
MQNEISSIGRRIPSEVMSRFYRTRFVWSLSLLIGLTGCMASPEMARLVSESPVTTAPVAAVFPVPIVELRGSASQLGQQHGQQMSAAIHQLFEKYLLVYVGSGAKRFIALSAANLFEDQLRPEHRDEVHALASQINIDERETMLGQCFLDLAQMSACSTITLPASASPDHVARFGRNLDFWSLNVADKYTTLFIVHPDDGRYAFAAVGWPGMIGVLSGMNEHGLCVANMEVPRSPRLPTAMPYTLLYRTVLERCRTTQEAVGLLEKTPRETANNLMLMDAAGTRAVVELSPESVHVRWGTDNTALISTNHQRDQDTDTPGRCVRYDYLHDQSKAAFGEIDEPQMQNMLAHVGSHGTLQSMIFEPANRVLYLSAGTSAAKKPFYRLDLTRYFRPS